MAPMTIGALEVSRTILVPDAAGRDYARYFDSIRNTSSRSVTVQVRISGNLGSDGSTYVWATASGDASVAANDTWFGTDDSDGDGDPTLVHALFGDGGEVSPSSIDLSSDSIDALFRVEVAAGETVSLMFFAFQAPNQAAARAQVEALFGDLDAALADLSPGDVGRILNWPALGGACGAGGDAFSAADRTYCGRLRIAVRDVEEPLRRAIAIAEELGGRLERQDGWHLVLRVPVPRFREALARLEGLGDVLDRSILIQTRSERTRALEIRLRSAMDVRARLTQLLARSQTAAEGLAITRELERLNLLIEELQAALRELDERAVMSTVDLRFHSTRPQPEPIPQELFRLPYPWLVELGLENLLGGF
jgi:hypothetical protein